MKCTVEGFNTTIVDLRSVSCLSYCAWIEVIYFRWYVRKWEISMFGVTGKVQHGDHQI